MIEKVIPESKKARAYLTGVLVILVTEWLKVSVETRSYIVQLTMTYVGGQTIVDTAKIIKGKK